MNEQNEREEQRHEEMMSRLSSLASKSGTTAAATSKARSRRAVPFIGLGLVAAIGVGAWQIGRSDVESDPSTAGGVDSETTQPASSPQDSNAGAQAGATDTTAPTPTDSAAASGEPATTTPAVSGPTSTTNVTTTTVAATTTTVATTTTRPPATTTAPLEMLRGIPSENLPGGQPWPNGLYQDDILYIRGTLPTKEVSDQLEARVVAILGRELVVNEAIIDPTVPMVETVLLRLGNSVLFKSGDFDIPPESELGFQLWALFLAANPDVDLTIVGHTDNVGSEDYNIALATRRAEVARDRIVGYDATVAEQIELVGVGPGVPIASNDTAAGRQLNRRVEFAVTGLFEDQ